MTDHEKLMQVALCAKKLVNGWDQRMVQGIENKVKDLQEAIQIAGDLIKEPPKYVAVDTGSNGAWVVRYNKLGGWPIAFFYVNTSGSSMERSLEYANFLNEKEKQ